MKDSITLGYNEIYKNYGFYLDQTPKEVLDELKIQLNSLQQDFSKGEKMNDGLAGEIQHEYSLEPTPFFKKYIQESTRKIEQESKYAHNIFNGNIPPLKFDKGWVNFQKKYEYNPLHNHTGLYSFVIWYQIPFYFENERKYFSFKDDSKECHHGEFIFYFPSKSSVLESEKSSSEDVRGMWLNIDKTKEGYMAIFPSNLTHTVYPFYTSDEYRITIAGNIVPILN